MYVSHFTLSLTLYGDDQTVRRHPLFPSLPFPALPRVHVAPTAPGPFSMCLGYGLQSRVARGRHGGDRSVCWAGGDLFFLAPFRFSVLL